ncbi:MAG: MBL fold metallo-hydrolase [Thermoguttaceae bacterium]
MVSDVAQDILQIDTEPLGHGQLVSSYLVRGSEKTALIDPGFPASFDTVVNAISSMGVSAEDLDYIVLTHTHFDHAGAAGQFVQIAPNARVAVHPRGGFYLKNGAKISGGARMVFGAELSDRLGETIDVPADRIMPVADGQSIDLGDKRLTVHYTPGHSGDHVSLVEESTATLFPGDMACLHYPELGHVLIPAGSPPIYRTDQIVKGLQRLLKLNVQRILTPHFGEAPLQPSDFLAKNIESVVGNRDRIEKMFSQGLEFPQVVEKMRAGIIDESGMRESATPGFLADVWLRVMLKTGLMGYMADILQYARDLRPFRENTPDEEVA